MQSLFDTYYQQRSSLGAGSLAVLSLYDNGYVKLVGAYYPLETLLPSLSLTAKNRKLVRWIKDLQSNQVVALCAIAPDAGAVDQLAKTKLNACYYRLTFGANGRHLERL